MADFGWAFIKGSSIQGNTNGILVKTGDAVATAQSGLVWDATNQTMTVTAISANVNALVIAEGLTAVKTLSTSGDFTAQSKIIAKQEIELGSEDGQYALSVLQSHSPSGGAILAVNSGEFFPSNYIGEQPGPYSVNSGSQVTVSKNAVVAIVSASTTLPAHLRSYVAEASQSS